MSIIYLFSFCCLHTLKSRLRKKRPFSSGESSAHWSCADLHRGRRGPGAALPLDLYAFGIFLIWTGFQLMREGDEEHDPSRNIVLKLWRRFLPLTEAMNENFFVRREGKILSTPFFVSFWWWRPLLFPLPQTQFRPSLRSLATRLSSIRPTFSPSWAFVPCILRWPPDEVVPLPELRLVGRLGIYWAKMPLPERYHVPTWAAFAVVAGVLALSVLASVRFPSRRA